MRIRTRVFRCSHEHGRRQPSQDIAVLSRYLFVSFSLQSLTPAPHGARHFSGRGRPREVGKRVIYVWGVSVSHRWCFQPLGPWSCLCLGTCLELWRVFYRMLVLVDVLMSWNSREGVSFRELASKDSYTLHARISLVSCSHTNACVARLSLPCDFPEGGLCLLSSALSFAAALAGVAGLADGTKKVSSERAWCCCH